MKKIFIIMIVMMVIAVAATAFAVTAIGTSGNPKQSIGGATFTPSQGVIISAASITTAYSATSAHQSSASGPGYEFQIENGYNGITKKAWAGQAISAWPDVETSATTTVAGFQ